MELLTTVATDPDFATFIKIPSRLPTRFLPPSFSELAPKRLDEPSVFLTTVLITVFEVPTKNILLKTPV